MVPGIRIVPALLLACVMFAAAAQADEKPAARKPNVVLILTDDQGYGDVGVHGNKQIHTPNLDRLAGQSVQMTRFYVSPVCAPTRASLLTGRYNLRCGVWSVTHGRETMHADEWTIAKMLKAGGYATGCFGKWHNGEHYPHDPNGQGFEEFVGFNGGHINVYFDAVLERNNQPLKTSGYITDVLTDHAIDFIRTNKDRPFFAYVPYNAPHTPWIVPDSYRKRYLEMGLEEPVVSAYAMCENIDENVGRILKTLDELKLSQDTIFIFMTDNGPNGARYNAGLRGRKGSVYEGGVRVPFFIRYPRELEPRKLDTIAAHIDVLPTLAELCGVKPGNKLPLDGVSIVPLLKGETRKWPDRAIFHHREPRENPQNPYNGSVRTQRYSLVVPKAEQWELYDLLKDPGEKTDIAAENPEVVERLRKLYEQWWESVHDKRAFVELPIPVGHAQQNPVRLPATEARLEGGLRFYGSDGYANDWATGWTSTRQVLSWDVNVVSGGEFEVVLFYRTPADQPGSVVRMEIGGKRLEAVIEQGSGPTPPVDEDRRNRINAINVPIVEWNRLEMGTVTLEPGRKRLRLRAAKVADKVVMDLLQLHLRRVD